MNVISLETVRSYDQNTMSLNDDLLRDLESEEEEEEEVNEQSKSETNQKIKGNDGNVQIESISEQLNTLAQTGKEITTSDLLKFIELDGITDITKISKLQLRLEPIIAQIEEIMTKLISKKAESNFLISVNELSIEINNEINVLFEYLKHHYGKRFPELSSLILNPIKYARIAQVLSNDLEVDEESLQFLSKDEILVLTMSTIQAKKDNPVLSKSQLKSIQDVIILLLKLNEYKNKISEYVSSRLAVFAPNITAIVGANTAAQLFSVLGGLEGLVQTPSCNIPSLGSKRSIGIGFGQSGIRKEGFLYYSDIIQSAPPELRKQAMRISSGKLLLASRIDYSGSKDNSQGLKWRKEIEEKISKLEEPPENSIIKALSIPIDRKSKKRAGRKYRKLKQRYEASELRKAQNRVEFGKQETTIMDSYGEEVGLGMTHSLNVMPININTKAKVTKEMKRRLEQTNNSGYLFNRDFINLPNPDIK